MKWLVRLAATIFIVTMVVIVAMGSFTLYVVAQLSH